VQIAALPDFAAAGHVTIAGTSEHRPRRVLIEFAGEGLMPRVRASASLPDFKFEAQLRPDRHYYARARNLPEDYYLNQWQSLAMKCHPMMCWLAAAAEIWSSQSARQAHESREFCTIQKATHKRLNPAGA